MPNKIIEELKEKAHLKGLSFSKNAKDCGDLTVVPLGFISQIVVEMLEQAIQSAKKEAVEEYFKEIEKIISKEKTMYSSDNPIIQTGLDNVMEQFKMKLIDKVKQKAKELLK